MGQTLTHGVYLPSEGERNCYNGLASNWRLLDGAIGTVAAHTTAISGKADISHTHGNISNDGKVGTTANLPLITGTGGAITAGAFGTSANTFCEGNDSRLSDARTPVAHTHGKADITDLFNSANVWAGSNTFSASILANTVEASPGSTALLLRSTDQTWENGARMFLYSITHTGQTNGSIYVDIDHGDANHTKTGLILTPNTFAPVGGGTNGVDLGTSTSKWKTLNGINPGALSLPDMDSAVSKSTELAAAIDKTQNANSWTADFTGILRITWFVKNLTGPFRCVVFNHADIRYATWGQTFSVNDAWFFIVSFPVQNGKTYYFDNSFTRTSEDTAPIIYGASAVYCLGNV